MTTHPSVAEMRHHLHTAESQADRAMSSTLAIMRMLIEDASDLGIKPDETHRSLICAKRTLDSALETRGRLLATHARIADLGVAHGAIAHGDVHTLSITADSEQSPTRLSAA